MASILQNLGSNIYNYFISDDTIQNCQLLEPLTCIIKLCILHLKNEGTKLQIINRITEIDKKHGLKLYIFLLENSSLPFIQDEIVQKMRKISKQNFGFDPENKESENDIALTKWKNWIEKM